MLNFNCDECPDYPCEDVMEKENRYTRQYPHRGLAIENQRMIRESGMDAFLEHEKELWSCPYCDKPYSVHDRHCPALREKIGDWLSTAHLAIFPKNAKIAPNFSRERVEVKSRVFREWNFC